MTLTIHDELLLKIYSIDYLLKCRIDEASEKVLKLSPLSQKVDMFQMNDPVVLLFYEGDQLQMLPAGVAAIDESAGQVTLFCREMEINEERRIFERYSVSLSVSVRRKFSSKRLHFVAKNISLYGMGVISQTELDEEECIDIDIITDKNMFYFSGRVIWKKALKCGFEYGFQLTNFDVATKQAFENYLVNQKAEYIGMFSKAR